VLGAVAAARALLLPAFELVPQEAYYAFYARQPALSYFDHPPLLAWLLALALRLAGHHALAVRAVPFLLTLGTQAAFIALARRFVPGATGRAALLFCTTGAVTLLSLIALPDAPLVLTWSLALVFLASATLDTKRWAWPVAGLFLGLAFDAKYTGAALWVGLLGFLAASPAHRRLLATPWPWMALGVAQLVALPVYLWNAEHGWASFLFQTAGRAETAAGPGLRHLAALLVTQAVLLLPPLLGAVAVFSGRGLASLWRRALGAEELFLAAFCLPVLLGGLLLSTAVLVKPNWLLPAYVAAVLWVARASGPRLLRWNLAGSAVLHVLLVVELLFYPVVLKSDDTWVGWRALASELAARVRPGQFVFSADDYKTTAELLFYSDLEVYGRNLLGERALQYDYGGVDPSMLSGREGLFVDSDPGDPDLAGEAFPPERLRRACRAVRTEKPIRIHLDGRVVRGFRVWRCVNYLGPPGR
jgi:4-amino-4-deoxy-L-arabinose transferase-like glycosyltransferase